MLKKEIQFEHGRLLGHDGEYPPLNMLISGSLPHITTPQPKASEVTVPRPSLPPTFTEVTMIKRKWSPDSDSDVDLKPVGEDEKGAASDSDDGKSNPQGGREHEDSDEGEQAGGQRRKGKKRMREGEKDDDAKSKKRKKEGESSKVKGRKTASVKGGYKKCTDCGKEKPLSSFKPGSDEMYNM